MLLQFCSRTFSQVAEEIRKTSLLRAVNSTLPLVPKLRKLTKYWIVSMDLWQK